MGVAYWQRSIESAAKLLCLLCCSAYNQKKGRTDVRPYYFNIYYFTISLLQHDMPHRHCSPTRIINSHVVNTRSAPRIDVDVRLLTVYCT